MAGTDGGSITAFILYLVTGGWVAFLAMYRLLRRHARVERREERRQRAIGPGQELSRYRYSRAASLPHDPDASGTMI